MFTTDGKIVCLQNVELLLKPINIHPVQAKTIVDKFAAVGILQVMFPFLFLSLKKSNSQVIGPFLLSETDSTVNVHLGNIQ